MPGPLRILIIEDSEDDAYLLLRELRHGGYVPVSERVETSEAMKAALEKQEWDIIISDYVLPGFSGLAALAVYKEKGLDIPFIIVSGNIGEDIAVGAMKSGAHDYIIKGNLARLVPAVERELREAGVRREKVRAEQVIKAANELLENIFSNVHVLLAYMDTDFNFIRVNNKYAEADGQGPEFFIGKNHFDLYPNEENEEIFRKVVETGGPYFVRAKPFTYAGHPERGTTFWDWSLRPVKDADGKVRGLVLSLIDVTQNIMLYAELMRAEHLASIGKLAAGVAHEVNNPINGIINYAQILLNRSDAESKEHEIAGRIIKESDRIAGIVSNLLTFARDKKEEKRSTDLRAVLADSLALMETLLIKNGVKLNMHMSDDLPKVIANHQQMQQVFINVISNANYALNRKYPGAHEDKILEITGIKTELEGKPYARMICHDHGTGIPVGILDRIMDPFFTTKYGDEGTGLGLSICHGIVNDHKGKIRVESVEDVFTKIIVDLPAL